MSSKPTVDSSRGGDCLNWYDRIPDLLKHIHYKVTHDADKEADNWFPCRLGGCLSTRQYCGVAGLQKHYLEKHPEQTLPLVPSPEDVQESKKSDAEVPTVSNTADASPLADPSGVSKGLDVIKCQICSKSYKYQSILNFHMKREHRSLSPTGETQFKSNRGVKLSSKCLKTPKKLRKQKSSGTVKKNRRLRKSRGQHHCRKCNKIFKNPYILKQHQITHAGVRPFQCPLCDDGSTIYFKNLIRHLKLVHKRSQEKAKEIADGIAIKYLQTNGKEEQRRQLEDKSTLISKVYSMINSNLLELAANSVANADEKEKSGGCNFSDTCTLRATCKHRCPHCPYQNRAYQVANHLHLHQEGSGAVACSHCGCFIKPRFLFYHMKYHHPTLYKRKRTHVCDQCSKTCASKKDLERHLLTHTGLRPYQCPSCEMAFNRKCNLKRHLRRVHRLSEDKV